VQERHEYSLIHARFQPMHEALRSRNMEQAREQIRGMTQAVRMANRQGREIARIDQGLEMVAARLDATRGMGGITGITTGWETYDETTGGYQDSDLITIVGRPSLGKTYILLKQAYEAHAAGHNVLFVTTEMGIEQISRRYASIALGINPKLLKMNMISTHMERRLRNMYRDMAGAERFNIFSVGMNSRINAIEAFMQEYGPSIVYVDGSYLLHPTATVKNGNRTERINGVFDELKGLTLESTIPIVNTSQFNRQAGAKGKDGTLENIGYTDAVGTHSSIVVALKLGPTENPFASRYMEFLKGREGESGEIAINFKFAPLDMAEFTPEQQEEEGEAAPINTDWMR
jgi:replicative DNA helicase